MNKPAKAATVAEYIAQIEEPRRSAIKAIHAMITKAVPKLKPSIQYGMIGYGTYHYKYDSGREGDAPIVALASQKGYISVYGCGSQSESFKHELPKANCGKGCIRFKKFEDVDLKALEKIVKAGASEREKANATAAGK
jgi:uncharacterized protein YdhG (YjbR/CyaY superfamily)